MSYDITYIWNLEKGTNGLIYQTEVESQMQKTNFGYQGIRGEEINWETEIDIYTLLYIKQMTNKNLLYSTGNSTQYSVMAYWEKKSKKKSGYMYMYN